MKSFTFSLFFILIAANSLMAQLYIGFNIGNEHYGHTNSIFQHNSSFWGTAEIKYQIKRLNLCFDYNNVARINEFSNEYLETQNNRFSIGVNFLSVQEAQKFCPSVGFGFFARSPYKSTSKLNINYGNYINAGLVANIAINFFSKTGSYFSFGYRLGSEFYNSNKNNSLKTNDNGFYFGMSLNLKNLLVKNN